MEEENMVQDESSSREYEGEGQYSEEEVDRIADTAIEAIQDILKSVSYTHLDVYKRQERGFLIGFNFGESGEVKRIERFQ